MEKFLDKNYKKIIIAIMLFMAAVSFLNAWNDAATFDEKAHIPAGYSYMKLHDMRLNPEHPPLIKDLSGIPLLFVPGIKFDTTESFWSKELNETGQWNAGNHLLWLAGNNADQIVFWSRVPIVILSLLLGLFIFKWVKELTHGNNLAGLFALVLYAFNPNILGHNHFVTTDIGIAAFSVFSFYYFLRFIKDPTWKNTVVGGIFLGLVLLAKFSAVLLFPIYGLAIAVYPFLKPKRNPEEKTWHFKARKFFTYIGKGAVAGIVAMFLVYVVYAFNTYSMPQEKLGELINFYFPANDGSKNAASLTAANNLFSTLNKNELGKPMAEYLMGLGMVFKRVAGGNGAYFMGEVSGQAFPLYFPVVYLIKEPLSSLFFLLLAVIIGIYAQSRSLILAIGMDEKIRRLRDYLRKHISEFSMLGFIILYWYVSLTGNLNIGFRHLFPAIPFMMILVAVAIFRFWDSLISKQNKIIFGSVIIIFSVFLISGTLNAYPYYMSYFNPVAGGPKNGFNYVTDSNADWGQDMKRLRRWIANYNAHKDGEWCKLEKYNATKDCKPIDKIRVNYFGAADPKYYLGRDRFIDWWDSKRPIEPGWYAISTNAMMGSLFDKTKKANESYAWLKDLEPVAQVGTSIFIYHVTPELIPTQNASQITQLEKNEKEITQEKIEEETDIKIISYKSKKTSIYFEYPETIKSEKTLITEKDNRITMYINSEKDNSLNVYALNLDIKNKEKVIDAILRTFSNGNKNCIVVKKDISGGVFNEIEYDDNNSDGEYDMYSKLGLEDGVGCGNYEGGGHAHFIYRKSYPNKVIWTKYGNYNILSEFDNNGTAFISWLKSIRFYE